LGEKDWWGEGREKKGGGGGGRSIKQTGRRDFSVPRRQSGERGTGGRGRERLYNEQGERKRKEEKKRIIHTQNLGKGMY